MPAIKGGNRKARRAAAAASSPATDTEDGKLVGTTAPPGKEKLRRQKQRQEQLEERGRSSTPASPGCTASSSKVAGAGKKSKHDSAGVDGERPHDSCVPVLLLVIRRSERSIECTVAPPVPALKDYGRYVVQFTFEFLSTATALVEHRFSTPPFFNAIRSTSLDETAAAADVDCCGVVTNYRSDTVVC